MDTPEATAVWTEFAEVLAQARAVLERRDLGLDDLDRAEGLRYLARLTANAVEAMLGPADPRFPEFRLLSNGFGMDNPDNHYLGAPIDARHTYVVRGRRGNLAYQSFAAQNQNYASAGSITGGAGHLQATELECEADGSFEIRASVTEQPGNWLRLAPDSTLLLARQTRADPATQDFVEVTIGCEGVTGPPPALAPARVRDRVVGAAMYVIGASDWFANWVAPWISKPNDTTISDPDEQQLVGGDPNICSQSGYWEFGPDQALLVQVTPPRCDYHNIQLANMWAESLDTRRRVWRNSSNLTVDPDGSYTAVVAHRDPGHPNWLDTAGHAHGLMHLRFVNSGGANPKASCRLVGIDEVPR